MKKITTLILILFTTVIFAQEKFTDATIQKFAEAYKSVRSENMTLQLNMLTAIEDSGLTSEKFTDIHLMLKNPETKSNVKDEDLRKYKLAEKNIEELNESIQENIERIIADKGLKVETYQAIAKASQSDPILKNKVLKLIE